MDGGMDAERAFGGCGCGVVLCGVVGLEVEGEGKGGWLELGREGLIMVTGWGGGVGGREGDGVGRDARRWTGWRWGGMGEDGLGGDGI